jgi:hypothetical protein
LANPCGPIHDMAESDPKQSFNSRVSGARVELRGERKSIPGREKRRMV